MLLVSTSSMIISYVMMLLSMAFFTLLERKVLGYVQIRKGPNKVSMMGLPQPLADAVKLFFKEQKKMNKMNMMSFYTAPMMSLTLALLLWTIIPYTSALVILTYSTLGFLCISSLSVYIIMAAGWGSNSNYALMGALRAIAQTISYEVSMALTLLFPLMIYLTLSLNKMNSSNLIWPTMLLLPASYIWFATMLAETNRTPFDHAEGESELVSGFNTEYMGGPFTLIFMAEYLSILAMSAFSVILFSPSHSMMGVDQINMTMKITMIATLFIWMRGTLPRMRYDQLMNLTWKTYLPFIIVILILIMEYMYMNENLPLMSKNKYKQ